MKTLRLAVLPAVLALFSGCPKDLCKGVECPTGQTCDSTTGTCTGIALADICDKIAQAQCDKEERCGLLDTAEKTACLAVGKDNCTVQRNVNGGVNAYDGAAAQACIDKYVALDCGNNTLPDECRTAIVTNQGKAGHNCISSTDCQVDAGLYCKTFNSCGVCTTFAGPGEFCNAATLSQPSTRCQSGLYCFEPTNDGGTCVGPRTPGQVCTFAVPCLSDAGFCSPTPSDGGSRYCNAFAGEGQPCTSSLNCQSSLWCNTLPGDGGASLCEQKRSAGAACTASTQCQMGLGCSTTAPRTCTQLLADGQPCTSSVQCLTPYCNRDAFATGFDAGPRSCGYLTSLDFCFIDSDCGPGNFCKNLHVERPDGGAAVPGNCATLDPDGGSCVNSETRASDSCANRAATCLDGKCVETPPFSRTSGQSCDNVRQCGGGSHCDFADPFTYEGHCIGTPVALGGACYEDLACGPHNECYYVDFTSPTGVCMEYGHRGQACDVTGNTGPDCADFLDCNTPDGGTETVCVPLAAPGAACDTLNGPDCYSSYCKQDAGICTPRQADGASCTSSGQCTSQRCRNPDGGFDDEVCLAACY